MKTESFANYSRQLFRNAILQQNYFSHECIFFVTSFHINTNTRIMVAKLHFTMLLLNVQIFLNSAMLMLILNAYMCLKLFLVMSSKTKKVTHLYNYNSTFQRKKKNYFLQMIDRSRNHLYTSSYILQKNVYIYILCHHFTLIDFHFFFGISIIHVVSLYN